MEIKTIIELKESISVNGIYSEVLELDIAGIGLVDISLVFRSFPNLEVLDATSNSIIKIARFPKSNIKVLNLSWNKIKDVTPLEEFLGLVSLDLSGNEITNIKPLYELINLKVLGLAYNPISKDEIVNLKMKLKNTIIFTY